MSFSTRSLRSGKEILVDESPGRTPSKRGARKRKPLIESPIQGGLIGSTTIQPATAIQELFKESEIELEFDKEKEFPDVYTEEITEGHGLVRLWDQLCEWHLVQKLIPVLSFVISVIAVIVWGLSSLLFYIVLWSLLPFTTIATFVYERLSGPPTAIRVRNLSILLCSIGLIAVAINKRSEIHFPTFPKKEFDNVQSLQAQVNSLQEKLEALENHMNGRIQAVETQYPELRSIVYEYPTMEKVESLVASERDQILKRVKSSIDQLNYNQLESSVKHSLQELESSLDRVKQASDETLSLPTIQDKISTAIKKLTMDKTGRADYALESAGGKIIDELTSPTFEKRFESPPLLFVGKLLGVRMATGKPPATAIRPETHPGQCWAMKGTTGSIGIQLAREIIPTHVTIEHSPKEISFTKGLTSAPHRCQLWGINDVNGFKQGKGGDLLGEFDFNPFLESLSTFNLNAKKKYSVVSLVVSSNWGHPDWTCIYRIRLHGKE